MGDLISRQAAIEVASRECHELRGIFSYIEHGLKELPSTEPERKKGKWIDYTDEGFVECPFCHSATNCDGNKDELHYCFSCGADMRGEQDE